MKQEKDFIEVPFGARDSELGGFEYTIPQGFEAEIKDGKVIVRKAESEDEKIKKEILEYFYQFENGELRGVDITSWIAWLEKQGKQKPVECCADKLWTEFKKQVAYLMASSYNREHEYTKGYVEWVAQSLLGYAKNEIEQKPAEWSEEDKTMLCYMEGHLEYLKNDKGYSSSEDQIMLKRQLEWLKSLKDRVQLQNITVTDEELAQAKKEAYNDALDKIEYHSGEPTFDDGWGAAIWYLKNRNAQPQNTWKPSDEQMLAIDTAINVLGKGTLSGKQLIELLEQLKK